MAGSHISVALSDSTGRLCISVFTVHVVSSRSRIISNPNAEIFNKSWRRFRNLFHWKIEYFFTEKMRISKFKFLKNMEISRKLILNVLMHLLNRRIRHLPNFGNFLWVKSNINVHVFDSHIFKCHGIFGRCRIRLCLKDTSKILTLIFEIFQMSNTSLFKFFQILMGQGFTWNNFSSRLINFLVIRDKVPESWFGGDGVWSEEANPIDWGIRLRVWGQLTAGNEKLAKISFRLHFDLVPIRLSEKNEKFNFDTISCAT